MHPRKRSPDGLTKAEKKADRPATVIQRDFSADKPDRKWLTDITQVTCRDGKLYAVEQAYEARKPGCAVIIHSDEGSQ